MSSVVPGYILGQLGIVVVGVGHSWDVLSCPWVHPRTIATIVVVGVGHSWDVLGCPWIHPGTNRTWD